MKCLETGKICPANNLKCKYCKLDECRSVLEMIEYDEKRLKEKKLKQIREQLPRECVKCSFLEVISIDNEKVRCAYRVKDRCLIDREV